MAKILVVDDDPITLGILEEVIRGIPGKINVFPAENAFDAIEIAKAERPDIIFLDVTMPIMDGFDACGILRKDLGLKDAYIVMVTGLDDASCRERGLAAGVDQYMVKPFDPNDLIDIVEEIIDRKDC